MISKKNAVTPLVIRGLRPLEGKNVGPRGVHQFSFIERNLAEIVQILANRHQSRPTRRVGDRKRSVRQKAASWQASTVSRVSCHIGIRRANRISRAAPIAVEPLPPQSPPFRSSPQPAPCITSQKITIHRPLAATPMAILDGEIAIIKAPTEPPNDQPTDGCPSSTPELPRPVAGPPFGGSSILPFVSAARTRAFNS